MNHEKCFNKFLKSLKYTSSLSYKQYNKIKAVGSRRGVLYDLCEVHKAIIKVSSDTSSSNQVSNCNGVVLEIYLDHKFQ